MSQRNASESTKANRMIRANRPGVPTQAAHRRQRRSRWAGSAAGAELRAIVCLLCAIVGITWLTTSQAAAQPRPGDPGTVGALIRPGQPGFTIIEVHTDEFRASFEPPADQHHRQVEFEDCVRLAQRGDECRWEQEGTVSRWTAQARRRWRKVYRWQVNVALSWWYGCEIEANSRGLEVQDSGSGFDDEQAGLLLAGEGAMLLTGAGESAAIMSNATTGCWMAEAAGAASPNAVLAGSTLAVGATAVVAWEVGGHLEAALTDCESEAWELQTENGVWIWDDVDWGPTAYPNAAWVAAVYNAPYSTTPWSVGAWGFTPSRMYLQPRQVGTGYTFDFPLTGWQACDGLAGWEGNERAGRWVVDAWLGVTGDAYMSRPEPAAYFPVGLPPVLNALIEEDRFPVTRWTNECDGEVRRVRVEEVALDGAPEGRSAPDGIIDAEQVPADEEEPGGEQPSPDHELEPTLDGKRAPMESFHSASEFLDAA